MHTFKRIDLWVQLIMAFALLAGVLFSVIWENESFFLDFTLLLPGLGAVQLLSTFIHFFFGKPVWRHPRRITYYFMAGAALILLGIIMITGNENTALGIAFLMLVTTPLIAIYHMFICYREIRELASRQHSTGQ